MLGQRLPQFPGRGSAPLVAAPDRSSKKQHGRLFAGNAQEVDARAGLIACALRGVSTPKQKAMKGRGKGINGKGRGTETKEPELNSTARQRFEQRRKQWAQMYQSGQLDLESVVKTQVDEERLLEEQQRCRDERLKAELNGLSDSNAVVQRLRSLCGEPWQHGVACLLALGGLPAAREEVLNSRAVQSDLPWPDTHALVVPICRSGTSRFCVHHSTIFKSNLITTLPALDCYT
eukprot:s2058_g6.t1